MAFDIIVYNQKELENALSNGYTSIALCDGKFILPLYRGICYTAIGNISVSINTDKQSCNSMGINCIGFIPDFLAENASLSVKSTAPILSSVSSFMMSSYFLSSFVTSYLYKYKGSFITSYIYQYEYEYADSFSSSYTTSFASSYSASFVSSYLSSFFLDMPFFESKAHEECILVNGYGINLI